MGVANFPEGLMRWVVRGDDGWMSGGSSSWGARTGAAVCAAAAAALVLVAVMVDLGTAERVASLCAAVLALAGLLVSLRGVPTNRVRRIAAVGSIGRAVIGRRNRIGPGGPAAAPPTDPTAPLPSGEITAGGDIGIAVIGDDNTLEP